MKFDISPRGMRETGHKATRQGQELGTDVRTLLTAIGDAGAACGGPIAEALSRLSGDLQQKTHVMSSRVASTVDGAGQATRAHVEGDHNMASNASQGNSGANFSRKDILGQGGR